MDNTPPIPTENNTNPNIATAPPASAATPSIPNPFLNPVAQTNSSGNPKKSSSAGLIIGLTVGGVALVALAALIFLFVLGSKVDYAATYDALKPLETSMDNLDYGNCYDLHQDLDDDYVTVSEYNQYVTGCVAEFTAVETATKDFAKSSGAKHDETIKSTLASFESTFKSLYSNKSTLESSLAFYSTYHEFYLTITTADANDTKNLESAVISAASLFQNTKNSALTEFANGFRERGLAYVRAIADYNNSPSYSSSLYSAVRTAMNDFTDYLDSIPEVATVSGLDFTKMNDLEDAYYKLSRSVRDAYYDHI